MRTTGCMLKMQARSDGAAAATGVDTRVTAAPLQRIAKRLRGASAGAISSSADTRLSAARVIAGSGRRVSMSVSCDKLSAPRVPAWPSSDRRCTSTSTPRPQLERGKARRRPTACLSQREPAAGGRCASAFLARKRPRRSIPCAHCLRLRRRTAPCESLRPASTLPDRHRRRRGSSAARSPPRRQSAA